MSQGGGRAGRESERILSLRESALRGRLEERGTNFKPMASRVVGSWGVKGKRGAIRLGSDVPFQA